MLLAFNNEKSIKTATVEAMKADIEAERLVKGHYWNGKNGCFVGCVIRGNCHADFELKLGIPRILARLADRIFEGLEYSEAKKFSIDFLESINVGSDLSLVWPKFAVFMLTDKDYGVIKFAKKEATKKAIQEVSDLYQRVINGEKIDTNKWLEARKYAYAAADAAAAYAAAAAAAADAARSRHFAALAAALVRFLGEAKEPNKEVA